MSLYIVCSLEGTVALGFPSFNEAKEEASRMAIEKPGRKFYVSKVLMSYCAPSPNVTIEVFLEALQ